MGKGNIIGVPNEPTPAIASGVWSLGEQYRAKVNNTWPPLQLPVDITFEGSNQADLGNLSFSRTMPAGKIIFATAAVNVADLALTVGGNPASVIVEDYTDIDKAVAFFEYDNTVTTSQTIVLTLSGGSNLDSIVNTYSVQNSLTISGTIDTLPRTSASQGGLIFMSQSVNAASGVPTATNALTVDTNIDTRTTEFNYSAHYIGDTTISTNGTLTASHRYGTILIS